jgi:hypothetical protein
MPQREHQNSQGHSSPDPSGVITSFDELAKGLATGAVSRGKALRLVAGVLFGGVLASVPGIAWADDDCKRFGRRCTRDRQCCSRNCVRRGDDKSCGCPTGNLRCGGRCVAKCTAPKVLDTDTCQCVCTPNADCTGSSGTVNPATCECECPPNMAFHLLSGRCVSAVCEAADAQRCAENPPLPRPDQLCCPEYLESGEPTGFSCCPLGWTCNINHGETQSPCTPP